MHDNEKEFDQPAPCSHSNLDQEGQCHDCGKRMSEPAVCQDCGHPKDTAIEHDRTAEHLAPLSDSKEKIAPVQGYSAGIPWSMHLRAYDAYCKKWGVQKALIDLEGRNCRGGFGTSELDEFIPGWRDELSEIAQLKQTIATLTKELAEIDSFQIDAAKVHFRKLGIVIEHKDPYEWVWKNVRAEKAESELAVARKALVAAAVPLEAIQISVKWELSEELKQMVNYAVKQLRAALAGVVEVER